MFSMHSSLLYQSSKQRVISVVPQNDVRAIKVDSKTRKNIQIHGKLQNSNTL